MLLALVAVALLALVPTSAAADGLPAVGIDARPLSAPGGDVAYTTKSGKHGTVVTERARYGGVLRQRRIPRTFSLPAVAYDGSPGGLSADGRTLVLIGRGRAIRAGARPLWSWIQKASRCAFRSR
jgi:hypothetical protein